MTRMLTPDEWSALRLSVQVAFWCTVATAVPGVLVGWLLARKRFPGKTLANAIVHLPLVLPPVAVGYVLLVLLGRWGPLGRLLDGLGIEIAFTWWAAVIASAVMGFPLLVRAVRLAVELIETRLEDAARTLGASPVRVWLTVTIPLALPGILTGLVLCFARSLGEFGATIIFAGNIQGQTRTLPLALFTYLQVPGGEAAAARLAVVSIAVSLLALVASEILARRVHRRMGLG